MILTIDGSNSISGGAISYLINLLKYAEPRRYGFEKVVLYGYKRLLNQLEDRPWLQKIHEPELDKGLLSRLRWLWGKFPNLVVNSDLVFFAGANWTKIEVPYVTICHNILPFVELRKLYGFSFLTLKNEFRSIYQSKCFENSKGIVFLSNYAKDIVVTKLRNKPRFIEIIPHGISERFFSEPKKQKGISQYSKEKPFRFVYVSQINLYKYQWSVVEAFHIVRKKGYPVAVDLVGHPTYKPAYKMLLEAIKYYDPRGNFARYLGEISYSKIHDYYKCYDAFIFASKYENLPFVLLEAMASGLPIVSSKFELTREILGNDTIYFDPRNPEDIADAVMRLIDDKGLREEIAWNNFQKSKKYSWYNCADKTFKFLVKLAK